MAGGTKITVVLGTTHAELLRQLARRQERSQTEILRRAIELEHCLRIEQEKGNALLIRSPDGSTKELVLL